MTTLPAERAGPGQVWVAGRPVCTRPLLEGWAEAGAAARGRPDRNRHGPRAGHHARRPHDAVAPIPSCIERAHEPVPEVSFFQLTVQIRSGYEGMTVALPPEDWPTPDIPTSGLIEHPLQLARRITPKSIAVGKRGPKVEKPKGYVDGATARARVATARVMAQSKLTHRRAWALEGRHPTIASGIVFAARRSWFALERPPFDAPAPAL